MEFWARRKAAVEAETRAEAAEATQQACTAQEAIEAEKSDAELLEALGLPEPETLGANADFKAFLAEGVPQRLKSRALRCLWRSNPVLANVDGLVDYGQDFTDTSCVIENMQTAYQVGKGMMAHVEELARQAEAKTRAAEIGRDEVPAARQAETEPAAAPDETTPAPIALADETQEMPEAQETPCREIPHHVRDGRGDEETCLPPRRRMAFTFDDTTA